MARKKIDYYEDWIKTGSKKTKNLYQAAWVILGEFYEEKKKETITPNILLERMIEDRKKPLEEQGEIEKTLNDWIVWLQTDYGQRKSGQLKKGKIRANRETTDKKGLSSNSIKSYLGGIRSFFSFYGYPLSKKVKLPRNIRMSNGKIENEKIVYRPDQVKKLLDVIRSPRDKAIVLLMFQSGMDISTTISLNYGDIKEPLERGEEPIMIHVKRPKIGLNYRTFIGHDTIQALKIYLNIRREKYKEEMGFDTPLFVSDGTHVNKRNRMKTKNFQTNMIDYVLFSGLVSKEKMERADMNPARPHALRSGFSSIARLKGFNEGLINYFQGHKDEYNNAYTIMAVEELREKYLELEPRLTVSTVSNMSDIEANLRKEIEDLHYKNAGMNDKIEDTNKEIDNLKQNIKTLNGYFETIISRPMEEIDKMRKEFKAKQ